MSALLFQRQIKVANVATNADSTPTIAIIRLDTNATVVATTTTGVTNPATGQYSYMLSSPVAGVTYRATWTFIINGQTVTASSDLTAVAASASGEVIDESDLIAFLGTNSLAIMSQQGTDDDTVSVPNVQGAIDKAEARAKSILGNWFMIPLVVGGVAVKMSSGIAKSLLTVACCQYAAFWLNKWRSVQSIDGGGQMSQAEIDQLANAWESEADADLTKMGRWAQGYSDGLSVDLDLLSSMPRASSGIAAIQFVQPQCRPVYGFGGR